MPITERAPVAARRIAIYLPATEFQDARAAYLADWAAGGTSATFGAWISQVLDEHAARTPGERAALASALNRGAPLDPQTRTFAIEEHVAASVTAGLTADHAAGRWPSESAWAREALAVAVTHSRQRDGSLPTPPDRLPNRLRR